MFKNLMTLAVAAAITLCFALGTANTVSADAGPADIVLKSAAAKKPSAFPHKAHQDIPIACADCHHSANADGTQADYVAGQEGKCESCHNKDMANAKLNDYKKAAHANCKNCHKKAKKDGKNAPTKCAGCHVKGLK